MPLPLFSLREERYERNTRGRNRQHLLIRHAQGNVHDARNLRELRAQVPREDHKGALEAKLELPARLPTLRLSRGELLTR
jgi:hypothetical protein